MDSWMVTVKNVKGKISIGNKYPKLSYFLKRKSLISIIRVACSSTKCIEDAIEILTSMGRKIFK